MKSLRGYPANYSPVSYEDVDITHMNYGEETAPRSYLEQIRYLLEEDNAGGYVSAFDRGFSGGLGRKVGGFINAVGSYPVDRAAEWLGYENVPSFSDRYNEIVQRADASEQQLREEHPYAAMGTELLGNAFGLGNAAYGIAGRFGLNGVTRLGGAGAIDAAVNTFGGAENISDAMTTLPQNTATGFVGGAVMGKLGEFGSKYGGQVLDWGQNKFRSSLNNRMQGILTDTSGHSINIPEIAARRQQIYDNFVFQNADKEVLDFGNRELISRFKNMPIDEIESRLQQIKPDRYRDVTPQTGLTPPQYADIVQKHADELGVSIAKGNPDLMNSGPMHFVLDKNTGKVADRAPFVGTLKDTYNNPDITILQGNDKNYIGLLNNKRLHKSEIDNLITRNNELYTKYQIRPKQLAKKLKSSETDNLSISQNILNDMGISPSLEYAYNISPKKIIVNRNLPNVSTLYNELTPTQVGLMDNALRQGLGQTNQKAGTLASMDKIRQAAYQQNGVSADLSAVRSNLNKVMAPHTGHLDSRIAQAKRLEDYYHRGYNNQAVSQAATGQQFHNNVEKQAYLQGQLQRLAQGGNTAQGVVDNRDVLQPLMPDFRYNRLYSGAQRLNDEYRNVLELRAKYARYLQDMYNKTAPHAVNDITQK